MPADVVRRSVNPSDILRWFKPDNQEKVIAAKIISRDLQRPFTVIAVADTDFIYDSFWTRSPRFSTVATPFRSSTTAISFSMRLKAFPAPKI